MTQIVVGIVLLTVAYTLSNVTACAMFYYLGYMKGYIAGSREVPRAVRRAFDEPD